MAPEKSVSFSLRGPLLGIALRASVVVTAVGAGCTTIPAGGPVRLAPSAANDAGAWEAVIRENTRRAQPYDQVTIRQADLRATLVTPKLRKAFLARRAEFQGRFAKEAERELVALGNADEGVDAPMKSGPDAEHQVVVFIAMWVVDAKNRDLAANYTIWDTRLVRGGASVAPIKIEPVRASPAVSDLFPYIDRFDDLYIARFPLVDGQGNSFLTPGGDPLRLEIKSAITDAVVSWDLTE